MLILKSFETYSNSNQSNQVLKKPVKLHSSQNVNYWNRCEFIRLRIHYGTEISQGIEYHSITMFQDTFQIFGECLFLCFWVCFFQANHSVLSYKLSC